MTPSPKLFLVEANGVALRSKELQVLLEHHKVIMECHPAEIGLLDLPHCVCFSYLLHVNINVKVGHQVPITRAKFAFNN